MKNLLIISFLSLSITGFGQFFEQPEEQEIDNSSFNSDSSPESDVPDQGVDNSGGNPGEPIPINHWTFLLPLAGLVVGGYYVTRKRLMN